MATYYWVGGSGTWDSSNTANWASTSGGAGGAGCPTQSDDVVFDSNSGSPLDISNSGPATGYCNNCTVTTTAFNIFNGGGGVYIAGSLYIVSGASWGKPINFNGNGTSNTIYAPGTTLYAIQFWLGTGTYTLTSNLSVYISGYGNGAIWFRSAMTLNTGNYSVNTTLINFTAAATFNIGSSTVTMTEGFKMQTTSATITGTGKFSMIGSSSKTFVGNGYQNYPTLDQGGSGTLTVTGSNKFSNITNSYSSTGATAVNFEGGSTNEFSDFNLSGTSGKLCTLTSTTTTQANLKKSTVWFVGANSTNSGNNSNLYFLGTSPNYLNVSYINGIGPSYGSSNFFLM